MGDTHSLAPRSPSPILERDWMTRTFRWAMGGSRFGVCGFLDFAAKPDWCLETQGLRWTTMSLKQLALLARRCLVDVSVGVEQRTFGPYDAFHGTPDAMLWRRVQIKTPDGSAVLEQTDYGHSGRLNAWEFRGVDTKLQPRLAALKTMADAAVGFCSVRHAPSVMNRTLKLVPTWGTGFILACGPVLTPYRTCGVPGSGSSGAGPGGAGGALPCSRIRRA
jgi:hypothetical protein